MPRAVHFQYGVPHDDSAYCIYSDPIAFGSRNSRCTNTPLKLLHKPGPTTKATTKVTLRDPERQTNQRGSKSAISASATSKGKPPLVDSSPKCDGQASPASGVEVVRARNGNLRGVRVVECCAAQQGTPTQKQVRLSPVRHIMSRKVTVPYILCTNVEDSWASGTPAKRSDVQPFGWLFRHSTPNSFFLVLCARVHAADPIQPKSLRRQSLSDVRCPLRPPPPPSTLPPVQAMNTVVAGAVGAICGAANLTYCGPVQAYTRGVGIQDLLSPTTVNPNPETNVACSAAAGGWQAGGRGGARALIPASWRG